LAYGEKFEFWGKGGGNGQVWEVSREGYDNHAAKLLSSSDEITYKRFKAEIHVLSNYAIDGMIP